MRKLGFGRRRGRAAVAPASALGPRPAPRIPAARALRRPAPCAMRHGGFMVLVDSPTAFFNNLLAESAASCKEEMGCCLDAPWVSQHPLGRLLQSKPKVDLNRKPRVDLLKAPEQTPSLVSAVLIWAFICQQTTKK